MNSRLRSILAGLGLLLLLLFSPATGAAQTEDVLLSLDTVALSEGDGATTVTATATRWKSTSTTATDVVLSLSGPSSEYTTNLDSSNNTITIAANGTSATTTFTITPQSDTNYAESDHTLTVSGTATGLSVAPVTLRLLDSPSLSFPQRIYAILANPGDQLPATGTGTFSVGAVTDSVGTVTYSHTAASTTDYGLTFSNTSLTLSGTLNASATAGTTIRYTITATDDMGTQATGDDKTATTIASVSVVTDQCSATAAGTGWKSHIPSDIDTDSAEYKDLVQNCNVLLAAKAAFEAAGTATTVLNWSASTSIRDWNGICFKDDTKSSDNTDSRTYRFGFFSECNAAADRVTTSNRIKMVSLGDVSGVVQGPIPPVLGHLKGGSLSESEDIMVLVGLEWSATHFNGYNEDGTLHVFYSKTDNNQITGPVPPELGHLDGTTVLSLAGADLENHSLPPALTDMDNLQYLYLFNTKLTGALPAWLPELHSKLDSKGNYLRSVYLNDNKLTGPIPWWLGRLDTLASNFWFQNNQLSGPIPWQLGNLSARRLDLSHNRLSGLIPWQLAKTTRYLYLNDNQLTGSIPPYLAGRASLWRLRLHNNQLTGPIPTTITNTTGLYMVYSASVHDVYPGDPEAVLSDLTLFGNNLAAEVTILTDSIGPLQRGKPAYNLPVQLQLDTPTAYAAWFPPAQRTITGYLTVNGQRFRGDTFTTVLSGACVPTRDTGYRCTSFPDTTLFINKLDLTAAQTAGDSVRIGVVTTATNLGATSLRLTGETTFTNFTGTAPPPPSPPSLPSPPPDRHGNTPATASSVAVGSTTSGRIHSSSDRDYFSLSVPQAGLLVVETTGRTDTLGALWDAALPDVALAQAHTGGTQENFQLQARVAAGTYTIAVSGRGTGSYRLTVDLLVGTVENPRPDSSQSGIGVLSGWVCEAETVEFELNGVRHQAAYGTGRADTEEQCGDTNNGFGLLYNWNLLGDGEHSVRVWVDDVEFDRSTVTVTTLGEEFVRGAAGQCTVEDFPRAGESVMVRWQEAQQGFVVADGDAPTGMDQAGVADLGALENPGSRSFQSGIGVISGWVCEADTVEVVINGQAMTAAYGTGRADTEAVCGDTDNGFGLLYNWNLLGDGEHTVVAQANGEPFARATVRVTTLGAEFVQGIAGSCAVMDFPSPGERVTLEWQQSRQNFGITAVE